MLSRRQDHGADLSGLQELLTYGLKGMAAYAEHAQVLGHEADVIYDFLAEALSHLAEDQPTVEALLALCLKCGEINLKVMELLDARPHHHLRPSGADAGARRAGEGQGDPGLRPRPEGPGEPAPADEGKGINIYTHGEMLPAHGYPGLKKYPHLAGNYGGAWQDQKVEFAHFPGAILMTTNCIQEPQDSYKTASSPAGHVGWPGIPHIANGDFSPVIEAALAAPGFAEDGPDKTILVGFGHNAVLGVADKVVDAVKTRRHQALLPGGRLRWRAQRAAITTPSSPKSLPKDCVILTLACGKFRFNKLDFGTIGGIPRLLDIGQCNDAYSAIQIAVALSKAFGCGVNDLPLSLVLSWYEQKAVAILLTLLHLGIRNIRLGPTLPAFVTPAVLKVLVEKFNLMPITTPEADLKAILGK